MLADKLRTCTVVSRRINCPFESDCRGKKGLDLASFVHLLSRMLKSAKTYSYNKVEYDCKVYFLKI